MLPQNERRRRPATCRRRRHWKRCRRPIIIIITTRWKLLVKSTGMKLPIAFRPLHPAMFVLISFVRSLDRILVLFVCCCCCCSGTKEKVHETTFSVHGQLSTARTIRVSCGVIESSQHIPPLTSSFIILYYYLYKVDDGYNIKNQNDGSSSCNVKPNGIYCFQIQSWITCCPECKTPLDEFADCILDTGRVIDETECQLLCRSNGSTTAGFFMMTMTIMITTIGGMMTSMF